jgi:transposase
MALSLDQLPDDPDALKRIIADLHHSYEERVESLSRDYQEKLEHLKAQLLLALKREFGRSSEAAPGQGELFNEAEQEAALEADDADAELTTTVPAHARRKPGRRPLPSHLPRVEIIHEIDEADRICPDDGEALKEIGEEVSEQLDIVPAQIRVIRRVRKKYACPACESHVARAPMPKSLIPKSIATPNLLSHIALYKYQDALPLYRQEQIFARLGIELSRTTQANWMIRIGQALAPLMALMHEDLLAASVVHSDETTVQVLKEAGRRPDQKSYMWLLVTGAGPPIVLYHYAPSRARSVVDELLAGYRGTLVTDGYGAYDVLPDVRHAGCWSHARRKFHEALKAQPGGKAGKAQVGFNLIQKLFLLERDYQELDPEAHLRARQSRSKPVVDELRTWLEKSLPLVSPKTLVGKALGYLDNQWDKLTVFLDDGNVPIHNNLAENKIRPFVIGRKNWLFSDTTDGAHASAALYSLMETVKANDLEPSMYLPWLFHTLPNTDADDTDALRALLPYRVDRGRIADYLAQEIELRVGADK